MNKVILSGRLTRDPDIKNTENHRYARYTLAVDRKTKKEEEQKADFISCVVFGKGVDFVEKYLHQGIKIVIEGRIQTGSYIDRNNEKHYTTDVIVEAHEFAESRKAQAQENENGFVAVDDLSDDDLPF